MLPSAYLNSVGSHDQILRGLNHAARSLAVYASQRRSPDATQDSLPAGDHLCRTGLSPAGSLMRFQFIYPSTFSSPRLGLAQSSRIDRCRSISLSSKAASYTRESRRGRRHSESHDHSAPRPSDLVAAPRADPVRRQPFQSTVSRLVTSVALAEAHASALTLVLSLDQLFELRR